MGVFQVIQGITKIKGKASGNIAEVNADNELKVTVGSGSISLDPGDIQIGAVEIKDGDTDARAVVRDSGGENALVVTMNEFPDPIDVNLQDGAGNDLTSTAGALDVNLASGTITVGEVGIIDSSDVRIDPATEQTVDRIADQTDLLAFDGDRLKVDAILGTAGSVQIVDAEGDAVGVSGPNGDHLQVRSAKIEGLLTGILLELRRLNMMVGWMSDLHIEPEEVEDSGNIAS